MPGTPRRPRTTARPKATPVRDSERKDDEYDDAFDPSINLARAAFAIAKALDRIGQGVDRLGLNYQRSDGPPGAVEAVAMALNNLVAAIEHRADSDAIKHRADSE